MNDLEERLANAERLIGGVLSNNRRQRNLKEPKKEALWDFVTRTGGTYTPAADWRVQFKSPAVEYRKTRISAGQGSLALSMNADKGWMATLWFDSKTSFSVKGHIDLSAGTVQVQDNGRIQEFSASSDVDVKFRRGRNSLVLIGDDTTTRVQFIGSILDGDISKQ